MKWYEKVLILMDKNNITQKQLSQMTGIAESSISRYLHSEKMPRFDIVLNFAKALNVEASYFLEDKDNSESAYAYIATAVARKGNELTPEEKNKLISLILGKGN